jgi:phenylpyruvate tautomerase PptA (4-oxalocrotonate tautomerase family)
MSSKIKHNKKRNTAFLYEALVRELTKATMKKDSKKKNTIVSIFKEFFKPHSHLARDLKLYQNILETKASDKRLAEKIIFESRLEKSAIDIKALFNEQSALISRINKELSSEVYTNFVPNYKDIATLHQIFNNPKIEAKQRVLLEESIIDNMVGDGEAKEDAIVHIDNVVYESFTKRFNKSYGTLNDRQKELLQAYVGSIGNDDLEMKVYLDDEIASIKEELKTSVELEVFPEQKKELIDLVESFSCKEIGQQELTKILKIQELLEESKKDD